MNLKAKLCKLNSALEVKCDFAWKPFLNIF